MFRDIGLPFSILAVILAASFARGFPSSPAILHNLDEPVLSTVTITINNVTYDKNTTTCVANVGFEIGKFFFTNYITHAFTIRKGAGDRIVYVSAAFLAALFLPYYGLLLACRSLESCANEEKDALKRAGRGGGLCVVARTKDWRPRHGERTWFWRSIPKGGGSEFPGKVLNYAGLDLEYISQDYVEVHGLCRLPKGYMLARLPTDCKVRLDAPKTPIDNDIAPQTTESIVESTHQPSDETPPNVPNAPTRGPYPVITPKPEDESKASAISSNFNAIRPLTAFTQLITAGPLIFSARESHRRDANGYAGYELTILPFLLMSILNTVSSIATPDYGAAYMIRSSIMKEAEARGGIFDGVFGALCESEDTISLSSPLDSHMDVVGAVRHWVEDGPKDKACSPWCNDNRMEFEGDPRIRCPGMCNNPLEGGDCALQTPRKRAAHAVKKGIYFVFNLQIWEGMRRELPVVRWIFAWTDKADLAKKEPNTDIFRTTPQRTSINRLFKTFYRQANQDEEGPNQAILLFPAIGNARYRKESKLEHKMFYIADIIFFLAILTPYLITYGLTGYTRGNSLRFERFIIVFWLVVMQLATIPQRLVWNFVQTRLLALPTRQFRWGLCVVVALGAVISVPGILGFYFVLHQLVEANSDQCDGYFKDFAQSVGFTRFGY